jgi:hypothetical protein
MHKLAIESTYRGEYKIGWYEPDDGFGLMVGHDVPDNGHPETREHLAINAALLPMADGVWSGAAFVWDTQRGAKLALKRAKSVMKQLKDEALARPWPAWAIAARDAGWAPPKGWTP